MVWARETHGFHVFLGTWKASTVLLKVKNRIKFRPLTCKTAQFLKVLGTPHSHLDFMCIVSRLRYICK